VETDDALLTGRRISAAFHEEGPIRSLWFVPAVASILGAFLVLNQRALRKLWFGRGPKPALLESMRSPPPAPLGIRRS